MFRKFVDWLCVDRPDSLVARAKAVLALVIVVVAWLTLVYVVKLGVVLGRWVG